MSSYSAWFVLSILACQSRALPNSRVLGGSNLEKRATNEAGLSKGSSLSTSQVQGIEQLLNRTASLSWEIGTHLEALVEFSSPELSVYSSSFSRVSPSTSPLPTQVLTAVSYLVAENPPSSSGSGSGSGTALQIVPDGSSADPCSIAPFYVLSNYTLGTASDTLPTNDTTSNAGGSARGATKETVELAVENQLEAILSRTPRTSDGAISHRVETTELWSDFVYMVPPFLAYYGILTRNTSMLDAAYTQCKLYRQYLFAPAVGLWRHIALGDSPDPGLWSTGNGWAANGMLRVVGSLQNSDYKDEYSNEIDDLLSWTREIVTATWRQPMKNGLLHNYLNESSSFAECSGTALLASATYRLSQLSNNYSRSVELTAAESAYQTLLAPTGNPQPHVSTPQGVLSPVVNPMDYSSQLQNVKADGTGNVSPEGEAFVLLMESARRDWIDRGGDANALMGVASSSSSSWLRTVSASWWIVAAVVSIGITSGVRV